jgi:hypothetical protein
MTIVILSATKDLSLVGQILRSAQNDSRFAQNDN